MRRECDRDTIVRDLDGADRLRMLEPKRMIIKSGYPSFKYGKKGNDPLIDKESCETVLIVAYFDDTAIFGLRRHIRKLFVYFPPEELSRRIPHESRHLKKSMVRIEDLPFSLRETHICDNDRIRMYQKHRMCRLALSNKLTRSSHDHISPILRFHFRYIAKITSIIVTIADRANFESQIQPLSRLRKGPKHGRIRASSFVPHLLDKFYHTSPLDTIASVQELDERIFLSIVRLSWCRVFLLVLLELLQSISDQSRIIIRHGIQHTIGTIVRPIFDFFWPSLWIIFWIFDIGKFFETKIFGNFSF